MASLPNEKNNNLRVWDERRVSVLVTRPRPGPTVVVMVAAAPELVRSRARAPQVGMTSSLLFQFAPRPREDGLLLGVG